MIIQVKRESEINGAIPSRVYLDNSFFGYGLENVDFLIPAGKYDVSVKRSEKFGAKKLYLTVPGRSGIMFHGGNTKDDFRGCIGVASTRSGDAIAGDLSNELYDRVNGAANAGEGVAAIISNAIPWGRVAILAAAGVLVVYIARKKRKTRK